MRSPSSARTRVLAAALLALGAAVTRPARAADPLTRAEAREAFRDQAFGLSVRWGVYSLLAKGEWVMDREKIPVSEYEKLPPRFNPSAFEAESWVKAAKSAGMKSVTVTAKHHDGFCMFDSKLTRYDVVDATPYGKDPLRALADACRKHKVSLFFYYSLLDWHHPDYAPHGLTGRHGGRDASGDWDRYVAYYQGQIRELCTNYGEIGGIWLDGAWDLPGASWDLPGTYDLVHALQPRALVGNSQSGTPQAGEDFRVFEKDRTGVPAPGSANARHDPATVRVVSETLSRGTEIGAADRADRSAAEVIRLLAGAAGRDANLLLDVGAKADGTLPQPSLDRLAEVGRWLEANGDSVYGTRGGPIPPQPWGVSTVKARGKPLPAVYLHILNPKEPVRLPFTMLACEAHGLGSSSALPPLVKAGAHAVLNLPEAGRSEADTVVVLRPVFFEPELPVRVREK